MQIYCDYSDIFQKLRICELLANMQIIDEKLALGSMDWKNMNDWESFSSSYHFILFTKMYQEYLQMRQILFQIYEFFHKYFGF